MIGETQPRARKTRAKQSLTRRRPILPMGKFQTAAAGQSRDGLAELKGLNSRLFSVRHHLDSPSSKVNQSFSRRKNPFSVVS